MHYLQVLTRTAATLPALILPRCHRHRRAPPVLCFPFVWVLCLMIGCPPSAQWASRPWKLKIKNRSSRFKNIPHMWMKQSWVRWDNSQQILFSPICCNWRLSQVKIISWQYLKLLLWQKIRFYNGIWLFKMYRRFQWNTNESKSISPCQICLMECQFSIATRRWTELLGPEVPVPPTVHCALHIQYKLG